MQQIAVVTGANKGIGLEVARQLGRAGMRVPLGVRDQAHGVAAADGLRAQGIDANVLPLDTTSQASVVAGAAEVALPSDRLDVLVNNAGISPQYARGILYPSRMVRS